MENKETNIFVKFCYGILIIMILTNFKGFDYTKIKDKKYIEETFEEGKTVIKNFFEKEG